MEPGNYIRIFLGRWKIILMAGLIGLAAGFASIPAKAAPAPAVIAPTFSASATTILIVASAAPGAAASANRSADIQGLPLTSLLATVGEVPRRAAEALGLPDANALASVLSVQADTSVGTLAITARDPSGERAAEIANTEARTLQDYLQEQKRARWTSDLQSAQAQVSSLQGQLDTVQASIARLPVVDPKTVPSDPVLNAQRDALTKQLQAAKDQLSTLQAGGAPTSGLTTLQEARAGQFGIPPVVTTQSGTAKNTTATTKALPANTTGATSASSRSSASRLGGRLRVPLAGALGLFFGAGLALLRERFDPRVRTRAAAERAFELPVIVEIPARRRPVRARIAVDADTLGAEAEAYRLLRSRILQSDGSALWVAQGPVPLARAMARNGPSRTAEHADVPATPTVGTEPIGWGHPDTNGREVERALRVILVTSPDAGDGKTAVTVNLAAAISEVGLTALVLDLDFRRSDMQAYFSGTPTAGLDEVVKQSNSLALGDVIHSAVNPRLHVALSGRPLANPSETLVAQREVLATARDRADVVLVDTPPMLAVSDTSELIPSSDGVLVVCRMSKTTVEAAVRTSEALARLHGRVVGLALVGSQMPWASRGYHSVRTTPRKRRTAYRAPSLVGLNQGASRAENPVTPISNGRYVEDGPVRVEPADSRHEN